MTAVVVAAATISSLGRGADAVEVGAVGQHATSRVALDAELRDAGVRRPYVARVLLGPDAAPDRARALLDIVNADLVESLAGLGITLDPGRTRIIAGTSSGGMFSSVHALNAMDAGATLSAELARSASYFGPLHSLKGLPTLAKVPVMQVLSACASSTIALGLGLRALQLGDADIVIAGGYDAVSPFVAAGFDALGATSPRPRPYRRDRDGLALGEGAAWLVLTRPGGSSCLGVLEGFSMAADAFHATQPHPDGWGLTSAARGALADAGRTSVDLVSGHGTATPLNDEREAKAILAAAGTSAPVHGFKGAVGHTLGAAGALESLAALGAMRRGVVPATVGPGPVIEALTGRVYEQNRAGEPRSCLKLSSAFGGANAALVWSLVDAAPRAARRAAPVYLRQGVVDSCTAEVAAHPRLTVSVESLQRFDAISRMAIAAALALCTAHAAPLPRGSAVVLGSTGATLEINAAFERKRRTRGAEPRRFPATSPNLAPCAVSIALGLSGPAFAVGGGDTAGAEAATAAADLVAAGDVPAAVVIELEYPGPFLGTLSEAQGRPAPRKGARVCLFSQEGPGPELDRVRLRRAWSTLAAPGSAALEAALEAACA